MTKVCTMCGKEKELDCFVNKKQSKDGKTTYCKDCNVERVKKWRAKNPKNVSEHNKRHYAKSGGTVLELTKQYKRDNKEKHNAHGYVARAVRDGKLFRQPCEVCGKKRVHAHHDDYSKPLDVRWLCPQHHMEHHMEDTI